jgi:hypothetical protein
MRHHRVQLLLRLSLPPTPSSRSISSLARWTLPQTTLTADMTNFPYPSVFAHRTTLLENFKIEPVD